MPSSSASATFDFGATDSISGVNAYSYVFDRAATTAPDTASEGPATSLLVAPDADGAWYLHVRARDAAGNWGPPAHRKILVDRTAIAPSLAAAAVDSVVNLSWTRGTDETMVRILRSTTGFASGPEDASQVMVYEGADLSFSDMPLVNGTVYYYTAFTRDTVGNWSVGAQIIAVPKVQASLQLSASSTSVAYNSYVTLRATYRENNAIGAAPAPVTVWSNAGGTWKEIGTARYSTSSSQYITRVRITNSAAYQFRSAGDATRAAAISNSVTVAAKTSVTLTTSAKTAMSITSVSPVSQQAAAIKVSASSKKTATVFGEVNATSPKTVKVYRYKYSSSRKRWVYKGVIKPRITADTTTHATFSAKVPVRQKGKWKLVAVHSGSGKRTYSNSVFKRIR